MRNPYKALEAIERLVGGDFGLDMECLLNDKRKKKLDPRLKEAAEIINNIYCIAHAEVSEGCKHDGWEDIKDKILAEPVN